MVSYSSWSAGLTLPAGPPQQVAYALSCRHHIHKKQFVFCFLVFFFFFAFLWPNLQHMEVPRLGVESELKPLAYVTATATWDLS